MVLHSNQLEGLRELAVEFIRNNPLPVLAPEVLLVQSNGMKHWLELTLAKELGICAATQIDLPSSVLWQIYRHVLGPDSVPAQMPLDKSPLTWRLMRRLPYLLPTPEFAPLQRYLNAANGEPQTRRLFQLAQQIADVFDGYQNYRAEWLASAALARRAGRFEKRHAGRRFSIALAGSRRFHSALGSARCHPTPRWSA